MVKDDSSCDLFHMLCRIFDVDIIYWCYVLKVYMEVFVKRMMW